MPLSELELEDVRDEDDGKEHVDDIVGTDGRFCEECNCDGIHEPCLEHLKPRLRVPRRSHDVAVECNLSLVPRAKWFIKIGEGSTETAS